MLGDMPILAPPAAHRVSDTVRGRYHCAPEEGWHGQVPDHATFPAARMGRRGEGLLQGRRARLRVPRDCKGQDRRQDARHARTRSARIRASRQGRDQRRELRLPLDGQRRRLDGPRQAVRRRATRSRRAAVFVPPESPITHPRTCAACRSRSATSRAATTRPSRRSSSTCRVDDIKLSFADGILFGRLEKLIDRKVPAAALFSGPYYFARAARLPQGDRHHVHDGDSMLERRARSRGRDASISARCAARSATSTCGPSSTRTHYTQRVPAALPRPDGHAPLGPGRAHRLRDLHQGSVRRFLQVDPRAQDLRPGGHGPRRATRTRWCRLLG